MPNRREALQSVAVAALWPALAPAWRAQAAPWSFEISSVSPHTVRIVGRNSAAIVPEDGALIRRQWGKTLAVLRADGAAQSVRCGELTVGLEVDPLTLRVSSRDGRPVQSLTLEGDGGFRFPLGAAPLYGLGEGGPGMDRRGNLDRMVSGSRGYELATHGSKVPVQLLMSAGGGDSAWAFFLHAPLGSFDLRTDPGVFARTTFPGSATPPPLLDIFVIGARRPAAILAEYAAITGLPAMPPLWSLGYLQSHRTLGTPEEILAEAATFREKRLPCDAMIYLGTGFCPKGWNTGNGDFGWNPRAFPDPAAAVETLHQQHYKVVLHVVLDGRQLEGAVADRCPAPEPPPPPAPQPSRFEVSCYWPAHKPLFDLGVDGWWPDEGDGFDAPSRLARNRMYFEGAQLYRPNQRVFALHRNGYAGMQRYASFLWSGDVQSTWKTLETQIAVGINAGLSGMPYWGTDIGGFVPTAEFTGELYARWFQFGAFCPLFRSHGRDWRLHLPWGWNTGEIGYPETPSFHPAEAELHNAAVEPICRKFLELRTRLLPYLYTAAHEGCLTGLPMLRALWLHDPDDATGAARSDEYMLGPDLLVAPVFEEGATTRTLYLPRGTWYDFWSGERLPGGAVITRPAPLDAMPLFVRAGAVLPLGPIKQYVEEASEEPLLLRVYPGADGESELYEDDGASFDYQHGGSMRLALGWREHDRELRVALAAGSRMRAPMPRALQWEVVGGGGARTIHFEGRGLTLKA